MKNIRHTFFLICLSILIVSCKNDTKEEKENTTPQNKTEIETPKKKEPKVLTGNDKKVLSSLLSRAMQTPSTKKYVSALISANLNKILSDQDGPFTVFAPSNEAFNSLSEENKKKLTNIKNKDSIATLLKTHIVEGSYNFEELTSEIKKNKGKFVLTTMSGATFTASKKGKDISIKDENGNRAIIVKRDIEASNGVMHVLNKVLVFN
ncbi:MAG: fasciclin domain-containing protein [Flavobacteriaceae bacterium]